MSYAEFAAERDAYFTTAFPTDADFARYTAAFAKWVDDLNERLRSKWPELFKKRNPLPLFDCGDDNNQQNKRAKTRKGTKK